MLPNISPLNPDTLPNLTDEGYPCFVDDGVVGLDALGDWWLDLGSVDLPDASAM